MKTATKQTRTLQRVGGALIAMLVGFSPVLGWAGSSKIDPTLDTTKSTPADVIVMYTDGPTTQHASKAKAHGGAVRLNLKSVKGTSMSIPANQIQQLVADDTNIVSVVPDRPIYSTGESFTPNFVAVNADMAQSAGFNGSGVFVAVLDSGIDSTHPDLAGRVIYAQDFTGEGTADLYGHGTHVAGIIAGNASKSTCSTCTTKYMGIAPGVQLVNLKVLDHTGSGKDSYVIAALETAAALKQQYPQYQGVLNLSFGRGVTTSYKNDPLDQAVETAWKAGLTVVVAAGNYGRDNSVGENGYGTITVPGNDPYVITVGAMNTMGTMSRADDVPASYSSKGPTMLDHVVKPDLVAPGNVIVSTLSSTGTLDNQDPSTQLPESAYMTNGGSTISPYYFTLSGTSMSTPVVSAAAAMLLQQHPNLTPDQIKARLMKTADKNLIQYATVTDPTTGLTYNVQADLFTVGAGYLDINAALQNSDLASSAVGSAMSPTVTYSTNSKGVTVSLHSLRSDRFASISGVDALPRVLRGIEKALDVGLRPVKINSVAIRGYNDDEIIELVEYARERRIPIRFIEFMPLDGLGMWSADKVVSGKEIIERVSAKYPLRPQGRASAETSSVWRFSDGKGEMGLITSMSDPFCDDCDRVRLTADGKLLSCLFDTEYYDLRHLVRNGGTNNDLTTAILGAVWRKPVGVGHMSWIRESWSKPRNMNAIGG